MKVLLIVFSVLLLLLTLLSTLGGSMTVGEPFTEDANKIVQKMKGWEEMIRPAKAPFYNEEDQPADQMAGQMADQMAGPQEQPMMEEYKQEYAPVDYVQESFENKQKFEGDIEPYENEETNFASF